MFYNWYLSIRVCMAFLENKCPALPGHDKWYNTTDVHVGAVVRASCMEGYLINDTDSITVTCDETGMWSADIPPCLRKYRYHIFDQDMTTQIFSSADCGSRANVVARGPLFVLPFDRKRRFVRNHQAD